MLSIKQWIRAAVIATAGVAAASALAEETAMERVQRTKELRVGAIAGAIPYFSKDIVSQQ